MTSAVFDQAASRGGIAKDRASMGTERLAQGQRLDAPATPNPTLFQRTASVRTEDSCSMTIIDPQPGGRPELGSVFTQRRHGAIAGKQPIGQDNRSRPSGQTSFKSPEMLCIPMAKRPDGNAEEHRGVLEAGMGLGVDERVREGPGQPLGHNLVCRVAGARQQGRGGSKKVAER